MSKVAAQAATAATPAASEGLLLRKCECGKHTVAGGECQECGREKQQSLNSGSESLTGGSFAIPRSSLQPQLVVGPSDDPLEREADSVADEVAGSGPNGVAKPRIQRRATQPAGESGPAPSSVSNVLSGRGQRLDPLLRRDMEMRFGHDFSRVRVHSGDAAEQSARDVGARAYTVGEQIVFGASQYQPGSLSGRRLIAHELTHVVQQSNHTFRGAALPFSSNTILRAVLPKKTERFSRTQLIGDGSAANLGINLEDFGSYISRQADWFIHPSLSQTDRDRLWRWVLLLQEGDYIAQILGKLMLADLVTATNNEITSLRDYADGANPFEQTVQITDPTDKFSRAVELGANMRKLGTFVPPPVLKLCINQDGLEKMVDENLVQVLKDYYTKFTPTIETPGEQDALLALLRGGLDQFADLTWWVHDLHIFTPRTRTKLAANVLNKKKKKPVLLILMAGTDWNKAFFQNTNLEAAVLNEKNLGLVIQGPAKLAEAKTKAEKVAEEYGQPPRKGAKGRLGQVVFAGHGSAASIQMATPGTGAVIEEDKYVQYDQERLAPKKSGDDSELLIDTVLQLMDPKDARIVFAGCLVGSHDIPETEALKDTTKAAAEINASLKANPNLRDLVNQRMEALKIKGSVQASNSSTTFSAFNVDPKTGKARLFLTWDKDVGGKKKEYVRTGAEPEGVLRAALETWADPKLGPKWTTKALRDQVKNTATNKDWWFSMTRTAIQLALPTSGEVSPAVLANLAHRVEPWLLAGWQESANAKKLAPSVTAAEAPKVYGAMLGTDRKDYPHLAIVVHQAWMTVDATHEANFLTAIAASTLNRLELTKLIKEEVVYPRLASLLTTTTPASPSRGQLRLALLIAMKEGEGMQAAAKKLLVDAAGGVKGTKFPAALNVAPLLEGSSEAVIMDNIGLGPTSAATGGGSSDVTANVDLDNDQINQTFVAVKPRKLTLEHTVFVRSWPNRRPRSKILKRLAQGTEIRIVGTTGEWTMIDLDGKRGFINKIFKEP